MLEYNDNVHIYPEKNQRHMIIDVQQYSAFFFSDCGGIHTTVHILCRVSGTGNRPPIPMDRVPTFS